METPVAVKINSKYAQHSYWKENWGAPLIIVSIMLLLAAAVSMSLSLLSLAEKIAVGAFCTLVLGVILQLFCFIKYNGIYFEEVV